MDAFDKRNELYTKWDEVREIMGDKALLEELLLMMGNGELEETLVHFVDMFELDMTV